LHCDRTRIRRILRRLAVPFGSLDARASRCLLARSSGLRARHDNGLRWDSRERQTRRIDRLSGGAQEEVTEFSGVTFVSDPETATESPRRARALLARPVLARET